MNIVDTFGQLAICNPELSDGRVDSCAFAIVHIKSGKLAMKGAVTCDDDDMFGSKAYGVVLDLVNRYLATKFDFDAYAENSSPVSPDVVFATHDGWCEEYGVPQPYHFGYSRYVFKL